MDIGVLHPGAMGQSVALALRENGHSVYWVSEGRSAQTAARAADLLPVARLDELTAQVQAVISVCPPEQAEQVAQMVADCHFDGVYVDANAVAPSTSRRIAQHFGAQYVDGGIIGPPAHTAGTTRLYLSGTLATEVADWFAEGPLQALAMGSQPDAASALKMAYAAYTKGHSALLLAVNALAEAAGVRDTLTAEWAISQPALAARSEATAQGTAPKAWRFAGEMQEIAQAFAAHDLPDGFHQAAAEIYQRMAKLKTVDQADLQQVLSTLR